MEHKRKTRAELMVQLVNGGREVPDLIRDLYEGQGMSQEEVAVRLGVHRSTVVRWMVEYGIPTRDRRALAGDAA